MKILQLLFFLCLPFNWLIGQISDDTIKLLVSKDSVSFYSFNKKGVSEYTVLESKKLSKKYIEYTKPFPKELKFVELDALSPVVSKDGGVYFLYPGGGVLFKYFNGLFERIDESFAHRNQFSGYFFEYKKELYLLGGYGYWKANSLLIKFNFEVRNWELVNALGQTPKNGINNGSFVLDKNKLHVFDFYTRVDDLNVKNNSHYVLDLDQMLWKKEGALNNTLFSEGKKEFELQTEFGNSLLQKNVDEWPLRIITPRDNQIRFYNAEQLHNVNSLAIVVGKNIVYPVLSADREYETLIVRDLYNNITLINEEYLTNDFNLFTSYFIYAGGFCLLLILITFVKFKKEKFVFFLSENNLSGLNKTIPIDKDERFVLELILKAKERKIDNSLLLNYFKNSKISNDASVKRKNKVIQELNQKVLEKFEIVLIIKSSKQTDSRQTVYCLNPKIEL